MSEEKYHDLPYLDLVKDVMDNGVRKENRTGMDTFAVFSRQLRFDLSDGSIPLLTTKKMHTRSILYELLWYLRGDSNIRYLQENGVSIWDEWSSPEGHLNNVYGAQWRRWENSNWLSSVVEIELKPQAGVDRPFVIPNTKKLVVDKKNADDLVGNFYSNNDEDEFLVIKKVSSIGSNNSRYLIQFTQTHSVVECNRPNLKRGQVRDPYKKTIYNEGCVGVYKEKPKYYTAAYNLWYNMMRRCYDTNLPEYHLYGGAGIFVDSEWRCFANFMRDIHQLPWFNRWKEDTGNYDLDKDYYGANCYSKETCIFLPSNYNQALSNLDGSKYIATNEETNEVVHFTVQRWFANQVGIEHSQSISTALQSTGRTHGWHIKKIMPEPGRAFRQQMVVDQIAQLIDKLRNNPQDRRLIVSAWNVGDLPDMALPPCHYTFQFYTRPLSLKEREIWFLENVTVANYDCPISDEEKHKYLDRHNVPKYELSLMLNQRSCDVGLGVPFNIVQYSILLHMVAQVVNMRPGEFIWNGGDVHIYENHFDALNEQLMREPYESPKLQLNSDVTEINDFKYEDFEIVGYEHHPLLKMEVSV